MTYFESANQIVEAIDTLISAITKLKNPSKENLAQRSRKTFYSWSPVWRKERADALNRFNQDAQNIIVALQECREIAAKIQDAPPAHNKIISLLQMINLKIDYDFNCSDVKMGNQKLALWELILKFKTKCDSSEKMLEFKINAKVEADKVLDSIPDLSDIVSGSKPQ